MRKITKPVTLLIVCLLSLFAANISAQSINRAQLLAEITALKAEVTRATNPTQKAQLQEQLKAKEALFLAPATEDLAQFATFLQQPHTGVIRLMPRELFDGVLDLQGGGAYYSFASLYQAYGFGSDLSLAQNIFAVGFAGADFGILLLLGNQTLNSISLETPGVAYLASFAPPLNEPGAREQQTRVRGFTEGGINYANRAPAVVGQTYVVRSVSYNCSDVLVAFRPFRRDTDGSLLIQWKLLKRFPAPQLSENVVATVSAASFQHTLFAPGSIAALFGKELANGNFQATGLPLPQFFGTVQVTVQDSSGQNRRASLFAATPDQINFIIPTETVAGYALLTVFTHAGTRYSELVNVAKAAPGLFSANASGKDVAAAVVLHINGNRQAYEPVARFDPNLGKYVGMPIDLGSEAEQVYLLLFGTGVRGRSTLATVSVSIGGVEAPVFFAGEQGLPGLDQINVALPRALAGRGEVDVVLTVDGKTANTVRINIK